MNAAFGNDLVNHHTYVLAGDGCLMEGICQEAITLAGHLKLNKLIVFWDNNNNCAYARRSADVGREAAQIISADEEGRQRMRQTKLRCPSLPLYVLSNLKALVENLDNNLGEQVADLVKCYYTQHARLVGALENLNRSSVSTITVSKAINLNPVFKDTLELYLRTKGMMQFARGKTENIADVFDTSEVLNALRVLNIDPVISPEAREYCLRFLADEKAEIRG